MSAIKGTGRKFGPPLRQPPSLSLKIPVNPIPAPRPRIAMRGKFPAAYYPSSYLEWRDSVAEYLQSKSLPEKFTGPLLVCCTFVCPAPKKSIKTHPRGDVDNYAKSILDSITKCERIWDDDDQVAGLMLYKRWSQGKERGHMQVDIWELSEDTR